MSDDTSGGCGRFLALVGLAVFAVAVLWAWQGFPAFRR